MFFGHRDANKHHEVGRVAGGAEHSLAEGGLVDGTHVDVRSAVGVARVLLGDALDHRHVRPELGIQVDVGHRDEELSGLRLGDHVGSHVPTRSFHEQAANEGSVLRLVAVGRLHLWRSEDAEVEFRLEQRHCEHENE